MQSKIIHTRPCPDCPLCGAAGRQLYVGMTDRVFNAPGAWNMRKCPNPDCGSLWLDPMPVEEDLSKLYEGYFTHRSPSGSDLSSSSYFRVLLESVGAAYLHTRYGYKTTSNPLIDKVLSLAVYLHPVWKDSLESGVFHLIANPGGRLLEIGCGSGAALRLMQSKGWHTTGLDFDEGAVMNARSKGLDVRLGELSAQAFADESFDAVVMSHVIEHVPAPGQLLGECLRILKNRGILVALTPNVNSAGHQQYGRYWRAFETPRHLTMFTPKSLANLAVSTGYNAVEVFTTMHGFLCLDPASRQLAAGKKHIMGAPLPKLRRIANHIKAFYSGWLHVLTPGHDGEEVVLVCRK